MLDAAAPNRRLRVLLNDCTLVKAENDVVVLAVSEALLGSARANEKELLGLLAGAWDRAVRLELRRAGDAPAAEPRPAPNSPSPATEPPATPSPPQPPVAEHPLVKQAIELFGARVVGVQPRKKPV